MFAHGYTDRNNLKTHKSGPQAVSCEHLACVTLHGSRKEKVRTGAATAVSTWRASPCDNTAGQLAEHFPCVSKWFVSLCPSYCWYASLLNVLCFLVWEKTVVIFSDDAWWCSDGEQISTLNWVYPHCICSRIGRWMVESVKCVQAPSRGRKRCKLLSIGCTLW